MASQTLINHFIKVRENLLAISDHIGIIEHGDVKGLAREALITQFLKSNLPSQVDFFTGEIVDKNDKKSGQMDIILQSFSSPKIHLLNDLKIAMADAVLGVIEVKSTLTTGNMAKANHLKQTLDLFKAVKELSFNSPFDIENHDPIPQIPCILFSYHGPSKETLMDKLKEYAEVHNLDSESFMPDLIVILDKDYALTKNNAWTFKKEFSAKYGYKERRCLNTLFVFLTKLIEVGNTKDRNTDFESYFNTTGDE